MYSEEKTYFKQQITDVPRKKKETRGKKYKITPMDGATDRGDNDYEIDVDRV